MRPPILAAEIVARGRKKGPAESGGIGVGNGEASLDSTKILRRWVRSRKVCREIPPMRCQTIRFAKVSRRRLC